MEEAKSVGANQAAATDDDIEIANLPLVDAVGDTVNGKTAEKLIAKLMSGGLYASVVGATRDAGNSSAVKVVTVVATPDKKTLGFMAKAVRDGELVIPISRKLPLSKVGEAQAAAHEGGIGNQGCRVASAIFASGGSTITWTGRRVPANWESLLN